VLEDSQLVPKMHLFAISFGGLRCDVNTFPIRLFFLLQSTSVPDSRESGGDPRVTDWDHDDISGNEALELKLLRSPLPPPRPRQSPHLATGRESM